MYIPSFFEPLRKFLKWEKVAIDNFIFRLHYKVTAILLLGFVVLVTAKQHFGDPIDCSTSSEMPITGKAMNSWCWLTGTFTLKYKKQVDKEICLASHSIHTCRVGAYSPYEHEKVFHGYYQWVSWIIFLQVLSFLMPRLLWKKMEGGKVKFITDAVPTTPPMDQADEDKRVDRLQTLYMIYSGKNNVYALKFFLCELLNLINVALNLVLVDALLDGRFKDYGYKVIKSYMTGLSDDPMGDVFPKMSKCQFDRYATGGELLAAENLCVLSLNIINDKVYLIMWIWLHFLLSLTFINFLYRFLILMFPFLRSYVLWLGAQAGEWNTVMCVATNLPIGDWFLLRQISKNVDEMSFVLLIERLKKQKMGFVPDAEHDRFATLKLKQKRARKSVQDIENGPGMDGMVLINLGNDERNQCVETTSTTPDNRSESGSNETRASQGNPEIRLPSPPPTPTKKQKDVPTNEEREPETFTALPPPPEYQTVERKQGEAKPSN